MHCISPPKLDDYTLLMYIDGDAAPQVAAHLRLCPHCQARALQLAQVQGRLVTQLYRITCPSPLELGEYHLGVLPPAQTEPITRHLRECPHCTGEVAQLADYLAELEPSLGHDLLAQIEERVRVLVARLVSGGPLGGPALAPAFAPVRGTDRGPLTYQAEDIQVVIEVQQQATRPDLGMILGLVIGWDTPQELQAHLWRAEQRL